MQESSFFKREFFESNRKISYKDENFSKFDLKVEMCYLNKVGVYEFEET